MTPTSLHATLRSHFITTTARRATTTTSPPPPPPTPRHPHPRPPHRPTAPLNAAHHTIYDVLLPGTHDSAAYTTRPELLSRAHILPLQFRPIRLLVSSVQSDFALTQTLSILEQLRAGARFLDIRVSKRPSSTGDSSFWTVHGMVVCVPLHHVIQQINAFHRENEPRSVTVVTVFRAQQLTEEEELELNDFVYHTLQHAIFLGNSEDLRTVPFSTLPSNVVAGLRHSPLSVAWGQDPWLDTYTSDKKISFLNNVLENTQHRNLRNDLLVMGWTVTPQTIDVTLRVLSLGFCRPGVKIEAAKMNARFPPYVKEAHDVMRERVNVIFFDCFTPKLATMVNSLNETNSDADDSTLT